MSSEGAWAQAFEAKLARAPFWTLAVYWLVATTAQQALDDTDLTQPWHYLASRTLGAAAFIVWLIQVVPREGFSLLRLLGGAPPPRAWLEILVLLSISLLLSVAAVRLEDLMNPPAPTAAGAATLGTRPLYRLLSTVISAPLLEEPVFRGVLFRKWRARFRPAIGLLLSSAVFGALHDHMLKSALVGAMYVLLYTSTRTLWAPLVAHVINNGIAVLLPIFFGGSQLFAARPSVTELVMLLGAAFAGLAWFVRRTWHTLRDPLPPLEASPSASSPMP